MDTRASLWALLCAFGIFIVLGASIPGALLSMFIIGVIPGTTYTLPLWAVMLLYPLVAGFVLYWITREPIYIGEINKPVKEVVSVKTTRKKKKSAVKQTTFKRRPRSAV